jgi:hypothetical protein
MTNGHDAVRAARLGTLLLTGGIVAVLALFALFAWAAMPNRLSGMNGGHAFITYVSVGVCATIVILAHVAIIRQLRGFVSRMGNAAR